MPIARVDIILFIADRNDWRKITLSMNACCEFFSWPKFLMRITANSIQMKSPHLVLSLDIDECATGTHNCSSDAVCNNTKGAFNCECKQGHEGDGHNCTGMFCSVLFLFPPKRKLCAYPGFEDRGSNLFCIQPHFRC